jgi:hypothetical protein
VVDSPIAATPVASLPNYLCDPSPLFVQAYINNSCQLLHLTNLSFNLAGLHLPDAVG